VVAFGVWLGSSCSLEVADEQGSAGGMESWMERSNAGGRGRRNLEKKQETQPPTEATTKEKG
jgi:hypothetical protein